MLVARRLPVNRWRPLSPAGLATRSKASLPAKIFLKNLRTSVTGSKLLNRRNLSSMPAGTQRYSRTKMVLPLRAWVEASGGGTMSMQWIHTIDISPVGCRLGGLHTNLNPGQTIALQRGRQKASFRVVWSRHLTAEEYQAGIEALDYAKTIWAADLPPSPTTDDLETSWENEDFSAIASTLGSTETFIPAKITLRIPRGLRLGLLLLAFAVCVPLYNGIFNPWGLGLGLALLSSALGLSIYQSRPGM